MKIFTYLLLIIMLTACGSENNEANSTENKNVIVALALFNESGQEVTNFSQNKSIEFQLSLTNHSEKTITLNFGCTLQYDFYITDSSNEEIWRWITDKYCDAVLTELVLIPGRTEVVSEIWSDQILSDNISVLSAGQYTATGSFLDQSEEATIAFQVQ